MATASQERVWNGEAAQKVQGSKTPVLPEATALLPQHSRSKGGRGLLGVLGGVPLVPQSTVLTGDSSPPVSHRCFLAEDVPGTLAILACLPVSVLTARSPSVSVPSANCLGFHLWLAPQADHEREFSFLFF